MAIQGDITIPVYGTSVALLDKYMRLSQVTVRNEWRITYVPRPDGDDGNPNNADEVLAKVREVSGTLDVYALVTDPENRIPPLTSREFTVAFNASGGRAERQLYRHIMSTLPRAVEV